MREADPVDKRTIPAEAGSFLPAEVSRIPIFVQTSLTPALRLMTIRFDYQKGQVLQALRYHFISKKEIRWMIILVNAFALVCIVLYAMKKIQAAPFLLYSILWIFLMISFWLVLPGLVYRRAETFRHSFTAHLNDSQFVLEHSNGSRAWDWNKISFFIESPHFFHLYFDPKSFLLIPKDPIGNKDQVHEAREFLKTRVEKR